MKTTDLLGVPLFTSSSHRGMGESPRALRRAGLKSVLGDVTDAGDVRLPSLKKDVTEGGVMNLQYFIECSKVVYEQTKSLMSDLAVLVGGECSLAPGSMAGLSGNHEGRGGLLWMDAHGDFNTPETTPSGYIGGMALAFDCGRGPKLGEIEARRPLATEERLVHVGSRALDPPEVNAFNSSPARLFTAQQVRKTGAADVAEEAARHLANRSDWIVCHLDVDVVDPSLIPAVSYPAPGGLTLEETAIMVRALAKTEKMKALQLCAYNSSKDIRHASARTILELVRVGLA